MLTNNKTQLTILQHITIDTQLPKWLKLQNTEEAVDEQQQLLRSMLNDNIRLNSRLVTLQSESIFDGSEPVSIERLSYFKRVQKEVKKIFGYKEQPKQNEPVYELDIIDFFSNVKLASKESQQQYVDRISGYTDAMISAEIAGQISLKEQLAKKIIINKYESVLYASDLYYVIDEKMMVDFVKKCKKGLQLVYIKNYVKPIPVEVINQKLKADELEVFDNYLVLYYDPENKSFSMTEEETKKENERKRDPILFGVISDSKKLYYIADWIDEDCDLTLDQFVDIMNIKKESLKLSEKI